MTLLKMKRIKKEDSPSEEASRLSIESNTSNRNSNSDNSTNSNNTTHTTASGVTDVEFDMDRPVAGSSLTLTSRDLNIQEDFEVVKTLAQGCFGFSRILLVKAQNGEKMVLKMIKSAQSSSSSSPSSAEDFNREMNLNYFLSPHVNIVSSYQISFVWGSSLVFVQEWAPYGDLSRFMHVQVKRHALRGGGGGGGIGVTGSERSGGSGVPESQVKLLASQLSSAVEFIHSLRLVHRDIRMENILLFSPNLSRIKICDFGETRLESTLVSKKKVKRRRADGEGGGSGTGSGTGSGSGNGNGNGSGGDLDWTEPPELCRVVNLERYYVHPSSDVWQVGVILLVCLTGRQPWGCADEMRDPRYRQYLDWHRRKSLRMPDKFKPFSPRLVRLIKRLLEPKPSKRSSIKEVSKYLKDDWIRKKALSSSSYFSSPLERRESRESASTNGTGSAGIIPPSSTNTLSRQASKQFESGQRASCKSKSSASNIKSSRVNQSLPPPAPPLEIQVLDKSLLADRVVDWIARSSAGSSSF